MPSLRIVYDAAEAAARRRAVALRNSAPADFAVTLTALSSTRRSVADVVLLLAADAAATVRKRLDRHGRASKRRGHASKLVAYWGAGPGCEIALFDSLSAKVDAWLFANRDSWEILGRPTGSFVLPDDHAGVAGEREDGIFAFLREVLEEGRTQPRTDLTKKVTAFVSTVGAPTFEACVARLRGQDSHFRLETIDHVAPMSAAFQQMLEKCRTPYYVQVDEDMLLYPHAIRSLYEAIAPAPDNVAMYVADLYDVHLRRCILGVKIFRHSLVRRFPFATNDAFETEQLQRLKAAGFVYLQTSPGRVPVAGKTLGLHGTRWTLPSIYERYATLERRRRIYPSQMDWFAEYPALFLRRYLDEPSAENFFALQGILAGALLAHRGEANAKDYRAYAELPGVEPLLDFLHEVSEAAHRREAKRPASWQKRRAGRASR